jgi:hypothetical protein
MSNETIAGPALPVSATVTTNGELTGAFAKVYAGNLQQSYDAATNGSDAGTIETALSMPVEVGPSLWNTSGTLNIEALDDDSQSGRRPSSARGVLVTSSTMIS